MKRDTRKRIRWFIQDHLPSLPNKYQIEHAVFSKVAHFTRCGSCFRCRACGNKGYCGYMMTSNKPDMSDEVRCYGPGCRKEIGFKTRACEWYEPRWYFNFHIKAGEKRYKLSRLYCEKFRIPLGGLRKPVPLKWVDGLNSRGEIVRNCDPQCPRCGEMPYSYTQCQFCGQRFTEDDRMMSETIKYTSEENGYTGILYGVESYSVFDQDGNEVMHTGSRSINTLEELKELVEKFPEFQKAMERILRDKDVEEEEGV